MKHGGNYKLIYILLYIFRTAILVICFNISHGNSNRFFATINCLSSSLSVYERSPSTLSFLSCSWLKSSGNPIALSSTPLYGAVSSTLNRNPSKSDYQDHKILNENIEKYGNGDTCIINEQSDIPIDFGLIERHTQILKEIMGIDHMDISLSFVTKDKMKKLNLESRGENFPTDILSFPSTKKGLTDRAIFHPDDLFLGDLFLCPMIIHEQAIEDFSECELRLDKNEVQNSTLERGVNKYLSNVFHNQTRIVYLIIHGLLHLLGYDHETELDYLNMVSKEEEIVEKFHEMKQSFRVTTSGHFTIGIGTDLCQISRFKPLVKKFEYLLLRHICSAREKYFYTKMKERKKLRDSSTVQWLKTTATFFAKRFAVKEAASKALGTGLRYLSTGGIHLNNVELIHEKSGKPTIEFNGKGLEVANRLGVSNSFATITDEAGMAFACVTLVGSNLNQMNTFTRYKKPYT